MTALITVKIAVLAPIPSAKVSTATAVRPGDLRSMRAAKRKSCHKVSTRNSQPAVRTTSLVTSRLPRSRRTARSASLRLIPSFIFSSAAMSKKLFSSSSSSRPTRSFRNSDRSPLDMFRSTDMTIYDVSRILAIAATCLPHSRVSLLSLFRPWSVRA